MYIFWIHIFKLQILEYLTLNSNNAELDALVPASIFFPSQKQGNVILKGTIFKENEK